MFPWSVKGKKGMGDVHFCFTIKTVINWHFSILASRSVHSLLTLPFICFLGSVEKNMEREICFYYHRVNINCHLFILGIKVRLFLT